MRSASNLHFCQTNPLVTEVIPNGPCAGDHEDDGTACRGKAKWLLHEVRRCTRHTASVLHDLPVRGAR